jgi:signal transduction histidine kinase
MGRQNVLIVDDYPENVFFLKEILSTYKANIITAFSGVEALEKIKDKDLSMALIDVHMPEMSGFELAKNIGEKYKGQIVPILFLSAVFTDEEHILKGYDNGAVDFITKPFNSKVLRKKIDIFLEIDSISSNLEREKNELEQKSYKSERLRAAFIAKMSHEIRTPMNAIIGFASLLTDPDIDEESRKNYTDFIQKSGDSLLKLIDNIIDIARIDAGDIEVKETQFNLNDLTYDIYKEFYNEKKRLNKTKVDIQLSQAKKDQRFIISTDRKRLAQVFRNLLSNAFKHTDNGTIEFGYTLDRKDGFIEFFVKDTGEGIEKELLKNIFDRFSTYLDEDKSKQFSGAGLGLTISKSLINMLGGDIWVESDFGKGANFYFTLPLLQPQLEAQSKPILDASNKPIDWSEKTILIAEDVESNYRLLESILRRTKAKLIWVIDGQKAVEKCKKNKNIDMVLMDIQLPIMNGYKATRNIRMFNPDIPIVAQTAFVFGSEKEEILKAGCNDYIPKPIKKSLLIEVMGNYLNK